MAALLKERLSAEVDLQVGDVGELSVWEGDRCLARKTWRDLFFVERKLAAAAEQALAGQR
ncbi:MAG TPA: hypothetical protein VFV75_07345 [Candidatus Polarisedimenticolaceae bacterium]|nr:hypothetical protein [Candidatus Polarisedimenticolaceae bacterium]